MLRPLRLLMADWSAEGGQRSPATGSLGDLEAVWPFVAGPDIAANARPARLRDGELLIVTSSSAWSQQLSALAATIVAGLREAGFPVERLRFRLGAARRPARAVQLLARDPARGAVARQAAAVAEPAEVTVGSRGRAPLDEAVEQLQRLRHRLGRSAGPRCPLCGAAIVTAQQEARPCAPCEHEQRRRRLDAAARLIYDTPWLGAAATIREIPGLSEAEYTELRLRLLDRWWTVLDRARKRGSVGPIERRLASVYVVLQTQLEPHRLTPALIRNVVGPELESLLAKSNHE